MKTISLCAATAALTLSLSSLSADDDPNLWDSHRVDSHAPIGVMGDHTHEAGEFMLSYRFATMLMQDNYIDDNTVSVSRIVSPTGEGFMVAPVEMTMEMHMAGLMFAPTDNVTLMFMAPYVYKSMDHVRRDGVRFTTDSEGWSDLSLTALVKVLDRARQRIHLNLGVGFPTGSINEKDTIPGPGRTQLPYPMQIGSEAWSLLPGVTYLGQSEQWSWGGQIGGRVYVDDNDNGYRPGNQLNISAWLARQLCDCASVSLRASGWVAENYDGADERLKISAAAVPTADPDLRGGGGVDLSIGLNLNGRRGMLKGQRLAIEAGLPVYQNLDGPQLGTEWFLKAGWQFAF